MSTWQPLATAPRDGTPVLVAVKGGWLAAACWESFTVGNGTGTSGDWHPWVSIADCCGCDDTLNPTHWMPLPEPPGEGD